MTTPTAEVPVSVAPAPLPTAAPFESFADFERRVVSAEGEREWFVDQLIPLRGLVMVAGEALKGKSLALQVIVAASVADESKGTFAGLLVERARVLYLHLEHQGTTLTRNLRAAAKARDADVSGVLVGSELDLDSDDAVEHLRLAADEQSVQVIIIDPLRRATLGNENDSNDTREWGRRLRLLTSNGRRLVIVVHHVGKKSDGGPRGSTDLKAMVDTLVTLKTTGKAITLEAEHHHAPTKTVSFQFQHDEEVGMLDVVAEVASDGSARDDVSVEHIADLVVAHVAHTPGVTSSKLNEAISRQLGGVRNGAVRPGRELAANQGRIRHARVGRTDCWYPAQPARAPFAPGGSLSSPKQTPTSRRPH